MERGSSDRASARTIQALAEMPSRLAADFDLRLQPFREAQGDAGAEIVTRRRRRAVVRALVLDDHELGVASGEAHLDVGGGKLLVERQRRFGEEVEQPQLQRRGKRLRQAACRLGRRVVTECRDGLEVGLDRLHVRESSMARQYDIILMSVKRQ